MKLVNIGIDNKEAVALTMEQFPSLQENGPTQPHNDIDHASALKEFTQYIMAITNNTERSTRIPEPPAIRENDMKHVTDYPQQWTPFHTQRKYTFYFSCKHTHTLPVYAYRLGIS